MAGGVGCAGRDEVKILLLCYEYPPVGGGGGRVAAQVAKRLVLRGHQIRVITAGMRHLPRRESRDNVEILRPESFRRREDTCTVPEMGLYIVTSLLPVLREARRWRPDIVHAHFAVPTGPIALAVRLFAGIPYVLTAHLGDVPGGVPEQTDHLFRLLGPFISPVWRRAQAVTAVSRFVAGLASKAYGVEPIVIPNGVNPVAVAEFGIHSPPRIVMVGRLSIQKNPLLAVTALALIKEIDWTLDVIGDGPLGAEMRALARSEGIDERVTLHGWLSDPEVAQLMARSDILLMTSLHEGLPMVAIEAIQWGLAIVGSRIGGMQDVIEEGKNGLLCELTPKAFAEKLGRLLATPELLDRMRHASREKAGEFDLEKTVSAYESVLKGSVERQRPQSWWKKRSLNRGIEEGSDSK
jgi:glycosyltransferase involved in cell wall biosynthesis